MPNLDLPILVVDDAKFSSMVVSRALKKAGYRDVRVVNNASDALQLMEQRAVSVLVADWLMPEMDGLELTDKVRQLDEQQNHYTYVILLTARESVAALSEAFDRGVDDFIYKSDMSKQLLPRVFAADRMADRQNTLLTANALLIENNRELESRNIIDLETGLCNNSYARERLERSLRQAEARGGASAYVLVGIRNWQPLKRQHSAGTMSELAVGIGRRLSHLIRPMDALCRVGDNQYAIIAHFENPEHCTTSAFRRIYDGINHKALKTTAGYISVEAGMALCRIDAQLGTPTGQEVENAAVQGLVEAYETRLFTETRPAVSENA
ncbi:MAG: diguanylate cyclase [Alteromonadaceae bacterium]|uniref:GGDEF domain-containing response regulator n=1 Tax=unclassified Marinobacter TaxID=83889 RepID=UPI000C402D4D|nr:response regulator [Marinobacter sp. BGYM27]MAA64244.1 diguanylate cyclase [Alteromonadaceae bacterium]MBH84269.1 diguanylate cyclase [Alteromonadaceae bacterium]MDG5498539.1 response regulator [Marinobacter sp. BGYM27]|tara:strand:- start:21044 stop:22015 length:972 start_codon:yes stop_codon:yes gene_type:complete